MEAGKAVDDTERRAARALARRGRRARLRASPRQESEAGPFDVIGDIHGCVETARALLARLGYESVDGWVHRHPEGRRALFLGDYIDRGPASPGALRLVHATCEAGGGIAIAGNHEEMLLWALDLEADIEDDASGHWLSTPQGYWHLKPQTRAWLAGLPAHVVVDQGKLVAAHAGVEHGHVGGRSLRTHTDALWGPQKARWWTTHDGARHTVVYGHYAVADPGTAWGQCICIDARCGFPGGALMAYRHPETTLVMVPMAESEHEFIDRDTKSADRAGRMTKRAGAS